MRRLTMVGLVACLLSAGVAPAIAQEPSPGPVGLGGRVEMAEFGFAITYPQDWAWVRLSALDEDAVVESLAAITDPDHADAYRPLMAEIDESFPVSGSQYPSGEDVGAYCGVGVVPTDLSLDEAVANVVDYYGADEEAFPGGATTSDVRLAAGEATRIDYVQMEPGWTEPWQQTQYVITDGSALYYVGCGGEEAPDDRWLSIADTLEFVARAEAGQSLLGQGSGQEPVGIGGRVEVPGVGYAVTAPDDWVTILPSAGDASSIIDTLREIDPELAATTEDALEGGVGFSLLMFGDFNAEQTFRPNCNVIDYAAEGMSLDQLLAGDEAAFDEMGERLANEPVSTKLMLPAGEAARLDYGLQYPELLTAHAAYYFSDGLTVHLLTCTDLERPEDDWLSVAETFEFLPAAE